jgi:hypothetical protein|tara:strand:- start:391 stop:735 length:345 start_codon:yes stop_codon:yes gene_type:complete
MKFIGQYVQNFIASFRSSVYLEDVDTGTIASGSTLGLDATNKIVKYAKVDDKHFVHDQANASAVWTIEHGLNKFPSVSVVDTAGTVIIGQVDYSNINRVTLTFASSFAGKAYFN